MVRYIGFVVLKLFEYLIIELFYLNHNVGGELIIEATNIIIN